MAAKGSLDSSSNFETTNRKESSRLEARRAYGRVSASFVEKKATGKRNVQNLWKKRYASFAFSWIMFNDGFHQLLVDKF